MTPNLNDYDKAILMASARQVANSEKYRGKPLQEVFGKLLSDYDIIRNRFDRVAGFTRRTLDCLSYDITPKGIYQFGWNEARQRFDRLDEVSLVSHGWRGHAYACAARRGDSLRNFPSR